jgi:hypothetical protein
MNTEVSIHVEVLLLRRFCMVIILLNNTGSIMLLTLFGARPSYIIIEMVGVFSSLDVNILDL